VTAVAGIDLDAMTFAWLYRSFKEPAGCRRDGGEGIV
jgi:hypothetical protein